jgi:hypothetical protein
MSASLRLLCGIAALIGGLIAGTAHAGLFDHIVVKATPDSFDGPCPTTIKLEATITFGIILGRRIKYVYRWEDDGNVLTDDVVTESSGSLHEHLETTLQVQQPVGATITRMARLHVFVGSDNGKAVGNAYSLPLKVTATCR